MIKTVDIKWTRVKDEPPPAGVDLLTYSDGEAAQNRRWIDDPRRDGWAHMNPDAFWVRSSSVTPEAPLCELCGLPVSKPGLRHFVCVNAVDMPDATLKETLVSRQCDVECLEAITARRKAAT